MGLHWGIGLPHSDHLTLRLVTQCILERNVPFTYRPHGCVCLFSQGRCGQAQASPEHRGCQGPGNTAVQVQGDTLLCCGWGCGCHLRLVSFH